MPGYTQDSMVSRTHDEFYLKLERKYEPKEYFKFIMSQLNASSLDLNGQSVLDVGCATGDFLYFLKSNYPRALLHGLEIMPLLADKARAEVPNATINVGDISSRNLEKLHKFDYIFMLGVHSIFDNFNWLDNIKSLLNAGGHFFCFGIFNPFDVDVLVKARKAGDNKLESGWNILSLASLKTKLNQINMTHKLTPWSISIPIERDKNDPYRSWTIQLGDGSYEVRNGLQINHTFYLLHSTHK